MVLTDTSKMNSELAAFDAYGVNMTKLDLQRRLLS